MNLTLSLKSYWTKILQAKLKKYCFSWLILAFEPSGALFWLHSLLICDSWPFYCYHLKNHFPTEASNPPSFTYCFVVNVSALSLLTTKQCCPNVRLKWHRNQAINSSSQLLVWFQFFYRSLFSQTFECSIHLFLIWVLQRLFISILPFVSFLHCREFKFVLELRSFSFLALGYYRYL